MKFLRHVFFSLCIFITSLSWAELPRDFIARQSLKIFQEGRPLPYNELYALLKEVEPLSPGSVGCGLWDLVSYSEKSESRNRFADSYAGPYLKFRFLCEDQNRSLEVGDFIFREQNIFILKSADSRILSLAYSMSKEFKSSGLFGGENVETLEDRFLIQIRNQKLVFAAKYSQHKNKEGLSFGKKAPLERTWGEFLE